MSKPDSDNTDNEYLNWLSEAPKVTVVTALVALTNLLNLSLQSKDGDGTFHYRCELEPSWTVGSVPQGGYSLGVILEACIRFQSDSSHPDPIYVSAQFLRATHAGTGQVQVKQLKSGKTFTNLLAELVQLGTTRITAHLIFGDLSPSQPGQGQRVLAPPSPYARRLPLYSHPSTASGDVVKPPWARKMGIKMSVDTVLLSHNNPRSPTRTTAESVGGGGVEWGAWWELLQKDDKLTASSIPFFCDSIVNLPALLPESEPGSARGEHRWYATIAMTVEFKARIPSSRNHSTRTVGVYCESRFQSDPEGRHNERVELWTAPSEIGLGDVLEGWRDHQYCIAVADQMALMLPVEMNTRMGFKGSVKL